MGAFIWVGGSDAGGGTARLLATELSRRHQVVVFREVAGVGHTWQAARDTLPHGLLFVAGMLLFPGAQPLPPPGRLARAS